MIDPSDYSIAKLAEWWAEFNCRRWPADYPEPFPPGFDRWTGAGHTDFLTARAEFLTLFPEFKEIIDMLRAAVPRNRRMTLNYGHLMFRDENGFIPQ